MPFAAAQFCLRYMPRANVLRGRCEDLVTLAVTGSLPSVDLLRQQEGTTGNTRNSTRANKAPESRGRPSPFLL